MDEAVDAFFELNTKIHALVNALGNPVRLLLGPGNEHDITKAPALIQGIQAGAFIADKAYDSDEFVGMIKKAGAEPVIPSRKNKKRKRTLDKNLYADRNKIEGFFCRLKSFRRAATRYKKTKTAFLAFLHLIPTLIWLA